MRGLALRLLGRQLAADRWVALLLGLLVAGTTALGLAAARAVDDAGRRDLRETTTGLAPGRRDLVGTYSHAILQGEPGREAAPYDAVLRRLAAGPLAPLSGLTGEQRWSVRTPVLEVIGSDSPVQRLVLRIGSGWQERMRVVEGRAPRTARSNGAAPGTPVQLVERPTRVEVAVTAVAARAMGLRIGQELPLTNMPSLLPVTAVVTGLLAAADPADPFWQDDPAALAPRLFVSESAGPIYTGVAFAGTAALGALGRDLQGGALTLEVRVPLDAEAAAGRDPRALVPDLRRAQAQGVPLEARDAASLQLGTGLDDALVDHLAKRRPVDALTSLLLVALLVAAAAVVLLGARLLLERRRGAVALAAARGTSARQALAFLAAEGLLLGVPGALLGAAVAAAVPGRAGSAAWLLPVVTALTPAAAVVVAAAPLVRGRSPAGAVGGTGGAGRGAGGAGALRGARRDLVARHGRSAGLVLVLALAALAAAALRGRGLDAGGPSASGLGPDGVPTAGIDLLVVTAPALLAVVVAVLVGRAAAPALRLATRAAARRADSVPFLGLARASREGAAAGLGLVALTLALAAALLSALTSVTAARATTASAFSATGADLRVYGADVRDDDQRALERLPGVRAVAPLAQPGTATVIGAGPRDVDVQLVASDPVRLADVQGSLGGGVEGLPPRVARELVPAPDGTSGGTSGGRGTAAADPLPVAVSAGLAPVGARLQVQLLARVVPVRVAAVLPSLPGVPQDTRFVLGSLQALRDRTLLVLPAQTLLARADPVPSADAVRAVVPAAVSVDTPTVLARQATSSPLVAAVRAGLPVALAVGGAYAALAVVLGLLLGGRARGRFVAHLRALGLSPRQSAALVALEAVPGAATGLVAGVVAGIGVSWLVLPAADLRALTGAVLPPPLVVPAGTVLAVVGVFAGVVALAVVGSVVAGRAVSPADAARTVEGT